MMEVGDDNMMKDWNHLLMIIRRTTEVTKARSEDESQNAWQ
jgi:hypothetical protein